MQRITASVLMLLLAGSAYTVERRVQGSRTTEDVPEIPAQLMTRAAQYSTLRDWVSPAGRP